MTEGAHPVTLVWESGREETVVIPPGKRVLDAALEKGLEVPFSCRWGACAACTGRLVEGDLDHVEPPRVLRDEHLDRGYVLPCVAEPCTPCKIEVGERFIDELLTVRADPAPESAKPASPAFGWASGNK